MDSTKERIRKQVRVIRALPPPAERVALRKDAGLTLQQVADAVGASLTAVWFWENGQRNPSSKYLEKYLSALDALNEAA